MNDVIEVVGIVATDDSSTSGVAGDSSQEQIQDNAVIESTNELQKNSTQSIAEAATPRGTVLRIVEDPVTGRKKLLEVPVAANKLGDEQDIKSNVDGDAAKDNSISTSETNQQEQSGLVPNSQQVQPSASKVLAPYSMEELGVALQMGVVDEHRLTREQAIGYGQYKERMAQQKTLANAEQSAQNQETQEQAVANRIEFLRKVDEIARKNAMDELGLSKEDFDIVEYGDDAELKNKVALFNLALESNRQRILADVEVERSKIAAKDTAQKELLNSVVAFADAEMAKEPKYKEINAALLSYCDELPRKVGERYRTAALAYQQGNITAEQVRDLEEYYNATKKMVYAKANKLSSTPQKVAKPPVVEKAGSGQSVGQRVNPSDLGQMNARQRQEWFRKNFK